LRADVGNAGANEGRQRPTDPQSGVSQAVELQMKPGLYANINAKKDRIEAGSKETMRKPGAKGAPTAKAFKDSAKTAKPKK